MRQKAELETVKSKAKTTQETLATKNNQAYAKAPAKKPVPVKTILIAGGVGLFTLILGTLIGVILMGGLGGDIGTIEVSPLVILLLVAVFMFISALATLGLIFAAVKLKSPESIFFFTLRLSKKILMRIHDFNGRERWFPGTVTNEGLTLSYNGEEYGFSPQVLGEGSNSFMGGIEIVDYAANNWMGIGILNAMGVLSAEDYYKDPKHGFKVLPLMDKAKVMHLYTLDEARLAEECSMAVSVDRSKLTWNDLPFTPPAMDPVAPQGETETAEAYNTRVAEARKLYEKKYLDEWNTLYGRKKNEAGEYTESEEEYNTRIQAEFDRVYIRLVTDELDQLKGEILRLKSETEGRLITSRVFTYHEAAKAFDPRIYYELWKKLKAIKESQKPKNEAPGWFKWVVYSVLIMVGGGVLLLLVAYALHMVGLG